MSTYFYSLRINAPKDIHQEINNLIGVKSTFKAGWGVEIIELANDPPVNFIEYFLGLLNGKYEKLIELGIDKKDISIWILYEYVDECNMEIVAENLKKIGENGLNLCISCWEKGK